MKNTFVSGKILKYIIVPRTTADLSSIFILLAALFNACVALLKICLFVFCVGVKNCEPRVEEVSLRVFD
jgi:hypothetical protein